MLQLRYPGVYTQELSSGVRTISGAPTSVALFVGPTLYLQLSERSRLTAAWSFQVAGHSAAMPGSLDLVNFERHQARLIYGINF